MKRTLLFIVMSFMGTIAFSQLLPLNDIIINDLNESSLASTKSAICGPDTVQYPMAKATGLTSLNINNATSAQALCQYYNAPQAITISGAEFFAYKINATGGITTNVNLLVYAAGPDSMPTGGPLASVSVPVDTTFGGGNLSALRKVGTFTPITLTVPYCVVVQNLSANGVGMISNDYGAADGQQEWLSSADLFGTWTRSTALVVGGTPYDADFIVHPVVTYTLSSNFTVTNPCLTSGPTVSFTNTSSPVLFDRMYNVAEYIGTPELSCSWDYGDGSPIDNVVNGLNVYTVTSNVNYDVVLTDTLFGWTSECVADTMIIIGDSISAAWSFASGGGQTVNFTE